MKQKVDTTPILDAMPCYQASGDRAWKELSAIIMSEYLNFKMDLTGIGGNVPISSRILG